MQDLILHTLPAFIFVLGLVVTLHELGHFLAAKAVGIRVEQFSIGFPPRMFGRKVGDTDYCISWVPLGGYVKMAGMIDESLEHPDKITGAPDEFMSKNPWQKLLVLSAGVLMNFLLASWIFTGDGIVRGVPLEGAQWLIERVLPDSPAAHAGIGAGDQVVRLDGIENPTFQQFLEHVSARPEAPIAVTLRNQGTERSVTVTPRRETITQEGVETQVGRIGVQPGEARRPAKNFIEAAVFGWTETARTTAGVGASLKMLVTGQASVKDLGGPLVIAKVSGDAARAGSRALFLWIAFISVNLGLLNILPLPALDGGHVVIVLIEAVARRPISAKIKVGIQQAGMVLFLVLMAVILWNDASKISLFSRIREMF